MDVNNLEDQLSGLFSDLGESSEIAMPGEDARAAVQKRMQESRHAKIGDECLPGLDGLNSPSAQAAPHMFVENSPVVFLHWQAVEGWPVVFVSENLEQFGYAAEELLTGRTSMTSMVHPDDLERVIRDITNYSKQRVDNFRQSFRIVTKDGQVRWVDAWLAIKRDASSWITHYHGLIIDVTERQQTEAALGESRALYQSSIDALPQSVYRIDLDGRITFGNKAYLTSLGMSLEECLGKTAHDFFPKELADKYTADDQRVMQTGELFETIENHQAPASDEMTYVKVVKTPIRDSNGRVAGLQAIFWDVSAQKMAEMALSRRAEELDTVAQVSTATATILDTSKLLQQVVDLTKDRFGLYHAHIYLLNDFGDALDLAAGAGDVGRQMVAEGWRIPFDKEQSLVAQAARRGQGVIVNDVGENPDHLPNPLLPDTRSEMAVPLMIGGLVLGVLDVQSDMVNRFSGEDVHIQTTLAAQIAVALQNTRQHEQTRVALAEVQKSQEKLRSIIDATPDWIFIKDLQHRYQLVNQGYANDLKLTPDDFIGKNDLELGFPEEIVKGNPDKGIRGFWQHDLDVIEGGQPIFIESEPAIVEGELHYHSTIKVPLRRDDGQIWGVLGYVRDITSLKRTEESLTKRADELSCLNDLGREMEDTPDVAKLLQWVTHRVPGAMQYPELCRVAVEYNDQVYGVAEAIGLPTQMTHGLYVGGQMAGRIYIAYVEKHDFLNEESALLGGIATRLSGYVENRQLFAQIQDRARREQTMREVTDRIRGSVDVDTIMRTAAQEVGQVLGRPAFVYLGDGCSEQPSTAHKSEEAYDEKSRV